MRRFSGADGDTRKLALAGIVGAVLVLRACASPTLAQHQRRAEYVLIVHRLGISGSGTDPEIVLTEYFTHRAPPGTAVSALAQIRPEWVSEDRAAESIVWRLSDSFFVEFGIQSEVVRQVWAGPVLMDGGFDQMLLYGCLGIAVWVGAGIFQATRRRTGTVTFIQAEGCRPPC